MRTKTFIRLERSEIGILQKKKYENWLFDQTFSMTFLFT